jgi:hypothetical protein
MGSPSAKARRIVAERSGGWCEWPACTARPVHTHHRLGRKAGGRFGAMDALINSPAWLLRCCAHHHDVVTSPVGGARESARASGWLLVEGQDARRVPVLTRHWDEPIYLDDEGCWYTPDGWQWYQQQRSGEGA